MANTDVLTPRAFAHTNVEACYQCGKCTAGCPVAEDMDLMPNQIVRLVQVGETARAASSAAVWRCVACQTCSERCPKGVDVAGVMDALREMSVEHGVVGDPVRRTAIFQRLFLGNIRRNGRLNELELIGRFKAAGFIDRPSVPWLLRDAMLAPATARRGKLHLKAERVTDRGVVRRIFDRCSAPRPAGSAPQPAGSGPRPAGSAKPTSGGQLERD